jgi:Zn finger protein HypA/HybF involved in hydrogenase expression
MARERTSRQTLAELALAVLTCGLLAGLFLSPNRSNDNLIVLVGLPIATTIWLLIRNKRTSLACEGCGQRFAPQRMPSSRISCPHCGQGQVARERKLKRLKRIFLGLGLAIPFTFVVVMVAVAAASNSPRSEASVAVLLGASALMILNLSAVIAVGLYRYFDERPKERECEACGELIPLAIEAGPLLCPNCRMRQLGPDEARKAQTRGLGVLLGFFVVVSLVVAFNVPWIVSWFLVATPRWVQLPIAAFLVIGGLRLALWLGRFLIAVSKVRTLLSESAALAKARQSAGEDGTLVTEGPLTIWHSGRTDPVPMLLEQIDVAKTQFESFAGEPPSSEITLRVLCFHDRDAFLRFHSWLLHGVDKSHQDSLYFTRPWSTITLCSAESVHRVVDPAAVARLCFARAFVERGFDSLPRLWLQEGMARAVHSRDRPEDLVRLNRRMVAAVNGGTAWSEDLFRAGHKKLRKLHYRRNDPRAYRKQEQFGEQAWSIVEYLCGQHAPDERKTAFLAFLKEKPAAGREEQAFFGRFGFGFGSLLDSWREWVIAEGIGSYEPPPPWIYDVLRARVLPVIRDRNARRRDRVEAIRGWASAGYVMGADTLIELLQKRDRTLRAEAIGALNAVSGLPWGDEPDRWRAWLDRLPAKPMSQELDGSPALRS